MHEHFETYLDGLGATEPIKERAEFVFSFYNNLGLPMEDICVSEYVDPEGTRQYESLWFFSSAGVMEAHNFLSSNKLDFDPLIVRSWLIEFEAFVPAQADEQSRLTLAVQLQEGRHGSIKASRQNCDHVYDIFKKYLVPIALQD